jgi:hypothetical protein
MKASNITGKRAAFSVLGFAGSAILTCLLTTAAMSQKTNGICTNNESAPSGCIAYEHADFGGKSQHLGPNRKFDYVGDAMNDKISSFRVAPGCHIVVWEMRNQGGVSERFNECQYVGDEWNDDVSSWSCRCR